MMKVLQSIGVQWRRKRFESGVAEKKLARRAKKNFGFATPKICFATPFGCGEADFWCGEPNL